MPFSILEWQLIIWAYAYEFEHTSLTDDRSFDRAAEALPMPTSIPDYDPGTGMWVHDVVPLIGKEFLSAAVAKLKKIGNGAAVTHITFPEGWLIAPPWELPKTYRHLKP